MFRRGLFVSLSLVFLVSSFACTKKQAVDTTSTSPEVETTTPPPVPETEVTESMAGTDQVEGGEVKMPVLEDVFFAYDSAALTGEAKRKLEGNARQLKDASGSMIAIEGHCDERGTVAYNLALGERRAKAARDYLKSLGISEGRMKTISYGEERPFDNGHNEAAWTKNRRAHFVVSPN
ncbi:MAG: peptidoglycan-associated lipoprotein Pal [Candidatus Krumholzibacteria bacterium]|nr:peptidoglycan-associated lipoprotein Pal [Candidatus Krumholzibacteria bacterium]